MCYLIMNKKVLILVFSLIIATVIAIGIFFNRPEVRSAGTGIVVINTNEMAAISPAATFPGKPASAESIEPEPIALDECWKCPIDGYIYDPEETGIPWENVSESYFTNLTNCTNKSMFVSVSCDELGAVGGTSTNPEEEQENVPDENEQVQGEEDVQEELYFNEEPTTGTERNYHMVCSENGKCVKAYGVGEDKCSADKECPKVQEVQLSPERAGIISSFARIILGRFFGIRLP